MFDKLFLRRKTPPPSPPPSPDDKLDRSAPIVIELARHTLTWLQDKAPGWSAGFVRVRQEPGMTNARASYAVESRVELISAVGDPFVSGAGAIGERLVAAMGKEHGVVLLVVKSDFSYEIKFEWDDLDRWMITKLNGATGLPAGL